MLRKPSPSIRTTLYRVKGISNLEDAVSGKYLKGSTRLRGVCGLVFVLFWELPYDTAVEQKP